MAALGGWIGEALVGKLVDVVSSYLKDQITWGANTKSALSKLKAALLPIQVALERAEKVELSLDRNPRLGEWIWELRDAVEEAEDVLDEMEYYRLERRISERDAKEKAPIPASATSNGFKNKLVQFFKVHGCCSASLFQHNCVRIGKRALKMDDTLEKVNAAVEKLELVNKGIGDLNNVINGSPLLWGRNNSNIRNSRETGHINTDEVVGREEDKKKVLKWLTESGDDCQGSRNISALTIWGVGGVGKTTLAQSVYNDDSLNFEVKMWVCVSNNNLDMVELMKKAIETQSGSLPTLSSMSSLQGSLQKIVESKKCLLVLDDVWDGQENQNQQQWESFIGILLQYAERGSKLLITSRMKYQGLPIKSEFIPLGRLEKDKSLTLFYKHAFDGVNPKMHVSLRSIGDKIAKKCGGLPLALKIIAKLLNENPNIKHWLSISEKDILNSDDVKKALILSYRCLPSNLQSCFRICSLFPQDYKFLEGELVTLWIGLGCINDSRNESKKLEDIGCDYLDILVNRSFFDYRIGRYTMHDLVHDLARDVSTGECLRVEGNRLVQLPKTLRHLFVDQLNSNLNEEISSLKRLRTLALNYGHPSYSAAKFPDYGDLNDNLKQLASLHALFVSSKRMPSLNIIGQLKHLRIFHLKASILNKPFSPLSKLYHLQDLKCEETEKPSELDDALQRIECDGIGNLVKLKHLVLPRRIFDQITQLRHLIELQKVELRLKKDNVPKLSDLKNLNKLCHLSIACECEITELKEAKEANINKKEHLETLSLSLNWTNQDFQLHELLCNSLKPQKQSKITDIEVANYRGVRAPEWMTSDYLPYVTHLKLSEWENLEHLPPLGQLPTLEFLRLENIAGVNQFGTKFFGSVDNGGFPSLEELQIMKMENLEEWTRAENTNWFPFLKKLCIANCQKLEALPALPLSLKELQICSVGLVALPTWQDMDEHEVSTSRSNIPVLEVLKVEKCQELMNFQPLLSECIFLEELHIEDCKSLKELPTLPLSLKKLELESVGLIALPTWHDVNDNEVSPFLEDLDIRNCAELVYVQPFLRKCVVLKELRIFKCPQILYSEESNPNHVNSSIRLDLFDGLSSLTALALGDFARIKTLDCLKGLSLEDLTIRGWENLISLDGLQALTSLTSLSISKCDSLITSSSATASESFDQTHSPFSLHVKYLRTDNFLMLQIEPLRCMKAVEYLKVIGDDHASCLPHQWLLQYRISLKSLWIWNCPLLESLPDELPSSLRDLYIRNCPLLKLLPERMPSSLKKLFIRSCPLVESLPNNILSTLEELWIDNCPMLGKQYKPDEGSDGPKIIVG